MIKVINYLWKSCNCQDNLTVKVTDADNLSKTDFVLSLIAGDEDEEDVELTATNQIKSFYFGIYFKI